MSSWWIHRGVLVSLCTSVIISLIHASSMEFMMCRPPIWLYPIHLFFSTLSILTLGQKYLRMILCYNWYVLVIRSRYILGFPLSLGMRIIIESRVRTAHWARLWMWYCGVASTSFRWSFPSRSIIGLHQELGENGDGLDDNQREKLWSFLSSSGSLFYIHRIEWCFGWSMLLFPYPLAGFPGSICYFG